MERLPAIIVHMACRLGSCVYAVGFLSLLLVGGQVEQGQLEMDGVQVEVACSQSSPPTHVGLISLDFLFILLPIFLPACPSV